MTGDFSTRLFRVVFLLAGGYNLAFGLWAGFQPQQFFDWSGIAQPRYPEIWACVGMVVGVYGLLYWYVAWKPERGRPIIAIGLLGKVLGPVGMLASFSDTWPLRLAMLNVYNDVIWWLPFSLYLLRGTRLAERLIPLAPWSCAGLHALALVSMAWLLQPGMLTETDTLQRAMYVSQNSLFWTLGWSIWMLSALSLVAFYAWWGAQLSASRAAMIGVLLASAGSVADLSGESYSVLVLVESAQAAEREGAIWNPSQFEQQEQLATLLTAGIANLLYTLGGMLLMLKTKHLPAGIRLMMCGTWVAGLAMTLSAVVNHVGGMVAATIVLFPLLIAWTLWMGCRWGGE